MSPTVPAPRPADCLFCRKGAHDILYSDPFWFVRFDGFPAAPGHVEAVPVRHVDSFFDLDYDEAERLYLVLDHARTLVEARIGGPPDGWTIGVNDGRAAGRSIDHLHIHLIPRYNGDVPDPRGGIRQCAPRCDPDAWTDADATGPRHPHTT